MRLRLKKMITACIPLELKRGQVTARRMLAIHPSAIDMGSQVNVRH